MKYTLLTLVLLWFAQTGWAQSDSIAKVDIKLQNAGIGELVQQIEQQTELRFFYDSTQTNHPQFNYIGNKTKLIEVLNTLLKPPPSIN